MNITLNDTTGLNLTLEKLGIVSAQDSAAQCVMNVSVTPPLTPGVYIGTFIAFLVLAIVFHEIGHWIVLRRYYPNTQVKFGVWPGERLPKLWTGNEAHYRLLTAKQRTDVYIAGILAGFLPIIGASIMNVAYLALLVPYIMGTKLDWMFIWENQKQVKQEVLAEKKKNGK